MNEQQCTCPPETPSYTSISGDWRCSKCFLRKDITRPQYLSEPPATNWTTLDSGQREEYDTGARRDTRTGKGRYDLLPPFAMRRVAGVYERGAAKYGDRNYEKGIPLTRYLDSALRHTFELLEGKTDEDHAAQAAWNLLAFLQTQEMVQRGFLPNHLNDMPVYQETPSEPVSN